MSFTNLADFLESYDLSRENELYSQGKFDEAEFYRFCTHQHGGNEVEHYAIIPRIVADNLGIKNKDRERIVTIWRYEKKPFRKSIVLEEKVTISLVEVPYYEIEPYINLFKIDSQFYPDGYFKVVKYFSDGKKYSRKTPFSLLK